MSRRQQIRRALKKAKQRGDPHDIMLQRLREVAVQRQIQIAEQASDIIDHRTANAIRTMSDTELERLRSEVSRLERREVDIAEIIAQLGKR